MADETPIAAAVTQPGEDGSPIWARLAGFPMWPARRCSKEEEESIMKLKAGKLKQVSVLFLGTRCDKSWVQDNSVSSFSPATLSEKFLPKKFKGDKDYRAATVEATRLALLKGVVFDDAFMELVNSCQQDFPLILRDSEQCSSCGGGCLSGPLMACQVCDSAKRHWHCFAQSEEGAWMCDACCKIQGLPLGSIVPFEEEPEDEMTPHSAPVASSTAAPAPTSARSSSRPSSSTFSKPSLTAPASFQNSNSNNSSSSGAHNRSASSSHSHRNASANHGQATTTPTASSKDRRSHRAKQNGDLNIAQQDPMTGAPSLGVECGADASGIDDQCFVCGLGGHLLLCDYPQCVRAYHQVCVARIFPESLDSQMCTDDGEGYLLGATGLNEPWFCPCHTCIGCHALQRTESTIAVQDMPYDLYERQKLALHCAGACLPGTVVSGASSSSAGAAVSSSTAAVSSGGKVRQKVLRSCCSCPVAVCDECENALSSGQTLLLEKRFTDKLECPNCSSRDPSLKLARLLERAWVRSGNTRLALPFLRPLLPLPTNSNSNINSNSRNNSSSSYHDELHGQHATTKNGTQDMSHDREPSAELPHIRSTADKSAAAEFFTSPDTSTRSKKRKDPPSRALELLDAAAAHSSCGESSDVGSLSYSLSYSNSSANSSSGALYSPSALHSAKEAWEAVIRVTAKQTPEGTSHKRNKTHHDVTEENVKPIDLLGVLDKIHRAQYRTVKEYYADLNYIRNLLKTKLASHYRDTGTEESVVVQLLSNHSVLMTFDTIIDSSYTYLSDKLLRVHELEQRIQEQMTEGLLENKEVETFPCSPDHVQAPAVNAENSEDSTVPINVSDEPQEESILKAGENIAAPALTSTTVVSDVNPVDGAEVASANSAPTVRTRRSVSAHITDTGSGPPVRSASASPQVTALMRVLWRVECTQLVPSTAVVKIATARSNSSNSNHSPRTTAAAAAGSSSSGVHAIGAHLTNSASLMHSGLSATVATATMPDFRIGERSLLAWTAYVEQGRFPTEHRGADDPFSMRGTIAANEARHAEKGVMQYKTREMLYGCGDPQFATYMANEMAAAQLMMGMTHSGLRESVSLFEGAPSLVAQNSRFSSYHNSADSSSGVLVEDESLVILDRLRDVTQRAVQLEERLRESHLARQRSILSTDMDMVTIGQAGVLTEMKLANDNLRWRLQQKDSLVTAQKVIIANLQAQLAECQAKLKVHVENDGVLSAGGHMDLH